MTAVRRSAPINLIVHYPKTNDGLEELSRRVADVHADAVHYRLKQLTCPTKQKLELLDAVIHIVKQRLREQVR